MGAKPQSRRPFAEAWAMQLTGMVRAEFLRWKGCFPRAPDPRERGRSTLRYARRRRRANIRLTLYAATRALARQVPAQWLTARATRSVREPADRWVWADEPCPSAQTSRYPQASPGISGAAARRPRLPRLEQNPSKRPGSRYCSHGGRVGRPTPENRGVPVRIWVSPSLRFACACVLLALR
jgi:hypothetical protein